MSDNNNANVVNQYNQPPSGFGAYGVPYWLDSQTGMIYIINPYDGTVSWFNNVAELDAASAEIYEAPAASPAFDDTVPPPPETLDNPPAFDDSVPPPPVALDNPPTFDDTVPPPPVALDNPPTFDDTVPPPPVATGAYEPYGQATPASTGNPQTVTTLMNGMQPQKPERKRSVGALIAAIVAVVVTVGAISGMILYFSFSERKGIEAKTNSAEKSVSQPQDNSDKKNAEEEDKDKNKDQNNSQDDSAKASDEVQGGKQDIRNFDFKNAVWPGWNRSHGHDSRFSASIKLNNGEYYDGGSVPHCFKMQNTPAPVFKDLNGDGYEDAVVAIVGTRNPNCALGDKAWQYAIVWIWDPQSKTAHYLDEPAVDVKFSYAQHMRMEAVPEGVKMVWGGGGVAYINTFKVSNGFIISSGKDAVGGWGGSCAPIADGKSSGFSSITASPKAGAPEVPDWKQGSNFVPAALGPSRNKQSKDDGRVLVAFYNSHSQLVCGWAK